MEMYNNTLCISPQELTGIVSLSALQKMSQRGAVQQVRRACYGTSALYVVESLPVQYRAEVYRRYPDLKEQAESKPFVESVEVDGKAVQFFADYVLSDGRHLTTEKQAEYANNCAVLAAFGQMLARANSHRMRQSKSRMNAGEFWEKAAAALPRLCDRWPNSLPNSPRRLRMKYAEFQQEGYVCMISKKYQNKNAAKVLDEEQTASMQVLLAHHNNLPDTEIARRYNMAARVKGWPQITASAVAVWREKFDLTTAAARRGATNFRNERTMQVKRSRPTAPFLMWTLDGWTCELLFQQTTIDKQGRRTTTYHNRLTLEVVLDPCCDYPIGYAIGSHETPALITEALRNAAQHSRELTGTMLRSCQIQCDRYAIKTMADLYNAMGKHVTPARAHNAKSKVIEPYFGHLNTTYCQKFDNWSGFGVTSDRKKQPNSEALNQLRHMFPDEQGVREQIHQIMAYERATKREQFMQMYGKLSEDNRLPLTKESYLLYFGATTGLTNALEGCGLRPTLLGIKRDYDCWDITFREHAAEKWQVRFDPDDLTEVLAVNEDGSRRYMLKEKYVQPMALAERSEGDAEQLAAVRNFNKQLETHVTEKLGVAYETVDRMIQDTDRQEALLLGRLLLTNSHGQHKLPAAQQRMSVAEIEDVTVETVEPTPAMPTGWQEEDPENFDIF
jgi:hypothetical protein